MSAQFVNQVNTVVSQVLFLSHVLQGTIAQWEVKYQLNALKVLSNHIRIRVKLMTVYLVWVDIIAIKQH